MGSARFWFPAFAFCAGAAGLAIAFVRAGALADRRTPPAPPLADRPAPPGESMTLAEMFGPWEVGETVVVRDGGKLVRGVVRRVVADHLVVELPDGRRVGRPA